MIGPKNSYISLSQQQIIADYYEEHGELESFEAQRISIETQRTSLQTAGVKPEEAEIKGFFFDSRDPSTPSCIKVYDASTNTPNRLEKRICKKNIREADSFYRNVFGIYPVNSSSKKITAHINHDAVFNGAGWHPELKEIYFGKCDPEIFRHAFFHYTDAIVHELGHATIQFYSNGLTHPCHQTGALQESISDVFAMIFNHYNSNTLEANSPDAEWVLSKDVVVIPNDSFAPIRSFKSPGNAFSGAKIGSDDQVAHWNEYVEEPIDSDRGGVHKYAGIPSHAFYLAATRIGSPIWGTIGQIWFKAMKTAGKDEDFKIFAGRTIAIASNEYGGNIANEVGQAWTSVGVLPEIPSRTCMQETAIACRLTGRLAFRTFFSPQTRYKCKMSTHAIPPFHMQISSLVPNIDPITDDEMRGSLLNIFGWMG